MSGKQGVYCSLLQVPASQIPVAAVGGEADIGRTTFIPGSTRRLPAHLLVEYPRFLSASLDTLDHKVMDPASFIENDLPQRLPLAGKRVWRCPAATDALAMCRGQRLERRRLLNIVARGDSQTQRQFSVGRQPADIPAWPLGPFPACERTDEPRAGTYLVQSRPCACGVDHCLRATRPLFVKIRQAIQNVRYWHLIKRW
jgi:hypothetical protein